MRPHLLLTRNSVGRLRSIEDVRRSITTGHGLRLWENLVARADSACQAPPLVPTDMIAGRDPLMAKHANPDYVIVQAVADRIMDAALVGLLTGEDRYRETLLSQIEALFDESHWPEWRDLAHHEVAADLRTGQLCQAIGFAYDWVYESLSHDQRDWIVDGVDRGGIRRYLQAYDEGAPYFSRQNNWQTCIVGGLGITGMAFGDDYPGARNLVEIAHERMLAYREVYGPDGEFNENPGYAAATRLPVIYFSAYRYYSGGGDNVLAQSPFPETCLWYLYLTAPPDRVVDFGDTHADAPPGSSHYAAVASSAENSLLQWYYLTYQNPADSSLLPLELLWYDDTVPSVAPDNGLPLGRCFSAHSACLTSRSDWHPRRPHAVVFGKGGHGSELHGHHDSGQLCIDGHGERLIVDLCSPPMYPADFFGENRYRYYNASVSGHNVLVFNDKESAVGETRNATIGDTGFNSDTGAFWQLDLTGCYDGISEYTRTVIHLLPGTIVVLDEAFLPDTEDISLRWHTVDDANVDGQGCFEVKGRNAALSARITGVGAEGLTFRRREHRYIGPFNRGRLGDVFEDRYESYVEARFRSNHCRFLSLFSIPDVGAAPSPWVEVDGVWTNVSRGRTIEVTVTTGRLVVRDPEGDREITASLATGDSV